MAFRAVENILVTIVPQKTTLINTAFTNLNTAEGAAVTSAFADLQANLTTNVLAPLQAASVACAVTAGSNIQSGVELIFADVVNSNQVWLSAEMANIMAQLAALTASFVSVTLPAAVGTAVRSSTSPFRVAFSGIYQSVVTSEAVHIQEILTNMKSDFLRAFQLGMEGATLCVQQEFSTFNTTANNTIQTEITGLRATISGLVNAAKTSLLTALAALNTTIGNSIRAALEPCLLALSFRCDDSCASTTRFVNPVTPVV